MSNTSSTNTSCNSCFYCNSCNYCNYCFSCDSCNSCNYCNYSKNLKMSEHQLFCWSENYNDSLSKQQKDYRVFNKQVTKERYETVLKEIQSIIPNPNKLKLTEFWQSITNEQIQTLSKIPEFDEVGFEYITDRKVPKEPTEVEKAIALLIREGKIVDGKILA